MDTDYARKLTIISFKTQKMNCCVIDEFSIDFILPKKTLG